jgi:CRP-like cAMP-binding protein
MQEEKPYLLGMVGKLQKLADVSQNAIDDLYALEYRVEEVPAHKALVHDGQEVTNCCLLVEGYACRHKTSRDGARQIVSFHIPGDVLDLQHCLLSRADHNVQMVTGGTVAWVPIKALKDMVKKHPSIGEAFARDALIDASIFREWILNVGTRDALARVSHMLCEFLTRRDSAGLASPEAAQLPFTQEQIGDATGLTPVHVNRMLRKLREAGVVQHAGPQMMIRDWPRLQSIADFRPAYLHGAA